MIHRFVVDGVDDEMVIDMEPCVSMGLGVDIRMDGQEDVMMIDSKKLVFTYLSPGHLVPEIHARLRRILPTRDITP
jgi:hypothetical protein